MAYPDIFPVDLGQDGWSLLYKTDVDRLLFLCGLRKSDNTWFLRKVTPITVVFTDDKRPSKKKKN